jgi:hypothetical protein
MTIAPDQLRRPRDLTQIIDTALRLYRQNFGEFLAIAAVSLPFSIVNGILLLVVPDLPVAVLAIVPISLVSTIVGIIAAAAIARAIGDIADGLPADFYRAYRQVLDHLGDLLLAALRAIVIPLLIAITIVGIPFAIYLGIRWSFFSQAVVIENKFPREAISLSERIVKGSWWRTFGILLIVGLLVGIASGAVGMILAPVSREGSTLLNSVMGVIVMPFGAGASTLLFFDLHSREREHVSTN